MRSALRALQRAPLVAAVIVLSIGLGVGAMVTVFGWMDHLVRRPLPAVSRLDELVSIVSRVHGREEAVSYPNYLDWRQRATTVDGVAAFGLRQFGVRRAGDARETTQSAWGVLVTGNYFEVLRVAPAAGRALAEDDIRSAGQVAVISHRLAQRFGGSAAVVGTQVRVNEVLLTIVGVAPPDFAGTYAGLAFDVWVPVTLQPVFAGDPAFLTGRDVGWLQVVGRRRTKATIDETRAEFAGIGRQLAPLQRESATHDVFVKPLDTGAAKRLEALFTVLLGMAALVSLIVCANVANLLLLRGIVRAEEFGIRLGLGASPRQLFAQLLTEAVLLGAGGALAGLAFAQYAQGLLPRLMPPSPLPLVLQGRWDQATLLVALAATVAMVLLFGLAPALHMVRRSAVAPVGRGDVSGTRRSARLRTALVVAQLALSMAALATAGAFLRLNGTLGAMDRGVRQPERVLVVSTDFDQAGHTRSEDRILWADRLLDGVRALPNVESAAFATFVPLGFTGYSSAAVRVAGYAATPEEDVTTLVNRVSRDYFDAAGVTIRAGRPIDARDTASATPVIVANESFVRRFLKGNGVGQELDLDGRRVTIVGVAADGKYQFDAFDKPAPPLVYVPFAQQTRAAVTLHVRVIGSPADAIAPVRRTFASVNPALPLSGATTLDEYTSLPLFPVRLATTVLGWLGLVALVLASTGLYGIVSYRLSQRRRELAVRLALGASPARLRRLVLRDGLVQAAIGVAIGTGLGLAVIRVVAARLPRLSTADPLSVAAAACLLLLLTALASLVPAIRATRVAAAAVLKR